MGSPDTKPTTALLRHYFRTTLRVLGRQLSFSVINLVGLSIGIATALLLLLFVRNEVTFDGFHDKADRTYRAWVLEEYGPDQQHFNTITPVRIGPTLADGLPEVEAFARFDQLNDTVRLALGAINVLDEFVDEIGPPFSNRQSVGLQYPRRSAANYEGGSVYLKATFGF